MNAIRLVDAPRPSATDATTTPHRTDVNVDILSDASQHSERVNFNANAKDKLTQAINSIVRGNPMHGAFLANFAAAAVAALPTLSRSGLSREQAIAQVLRLAPRSSENPTKAKEGIASAVVDFLALKSAADVVEKKASARGLSGAEVMVAIGRGDTSLAEMAAAATFAAEMLQANVAPSQQRSAQYAGLDGVLLLAQSAVNMVMTCHDAQLPVDRLETHWVSMFGPVTEVVNNIIPREVWTALLTQVARQLGRLGA